MTAVDRALANAESVHSLEDITTPWQLDAVELAKEVRRLRLLCQQVHDRMLRGQGLLRLLEMLEQGWNPTPPAKRWKG